MKTSGVSRANWSLPHLPAGTVWLVGAGPGDPGLLTMHAVSALQQADVVLHDALVTEAVLSLVGPSTRLEPTGKRGNQVSMPQEEITRRLIVHAKQGLRVVRLKGGDPFVFGRGSEEALALIEHGVPVSIVPGITAGIGALTSAAIPLTARETNSAVTLATGHFAEGQDNRIDWHALAAVGQPIVLYMAVRQLGTIAARLIEGGMSPETPVAIVSEGTSDGQRVLETQLARAKQDLTLAGMDTPAIIAIGTNVTLRKTLLAGVVPLKATVASPGQDAWTFLPHPA